MRVSKEKFLSIWENFNAFQSQCKNRKSVSQMSHTWHGQQRIGSRHKKYLLIEVKQKVTLIWINDNKGEDENIQKIWGNCYSRQMNVFGWKRKSLSLSYTLSFSLSRFFLYKCCRLLRKSGNIRKYQKILGIYKMPQQLLKYLPMALWKRRKEAESIKSLKIYQFYFA